MPTVEIAFTPLPAHVRTARLVAVVTAQRGGVPPELLDEVRLAVGEACSRAFAVHAAAGTSAPVKMRLSDDRDCFAVEVIDVGQLTDSDETDPVLPDVESLMDQDLPDDAPYPMPSGFGLAVISGLVEDVEISSSADGTAVKMAWPARPGSRGIIPEPRD